MADLTLGISIQHTKEPRNSWRPEDGNPTATQTGVGVFDNTFDIGTTAEDISFGDVVPGLVILINQDDTNFVDYGMNDGGASKLPFRLYPDGRWPGINFMKPGVTLRLQADTASCKVRVIAYTL
jgi:hypothetical protein